MPVIHYNPITQEKRSEFINLTTLTNDAAPASVKVLCLIPGVAGLGLLILQTVSKHPVRGIVIIFMSLTPFIIALTDLRIVDAVTQIGARLPPDAEFATLLGFLGLFVAPVLLLAGIRSRSYRPDSQAAYWFGAIGAGFWFAFLTIPALPAEGGHIFMIAPVKMLGKTGLERLAIGLIALLACTSASALVCVANGPSGNTMKARNQANLSFWTLVVGQIVWMLFLASAVIESFPDIVGSIKSLCLFGGMFLLLPTGITDIVVGRAHHHHQESVQTDHPHTPPEDTPRRMV
jgi:hypothetical protein